MHTETYTFDINLFSDFYKDINGFRPKNHSFYHSDTTDEERQDMWNDLMDAHDNAMIQYENQNLVNIDEFERTVLRNISYGAPDRQTAIRWIIQGLDLSEFDLMYGGGYVAYKLDLPHKYKEEFDAIIKTI